MDDPVWLATGAQTDTDPLGPDAGSFLLESRSSGGLDVRMEATWSADAGLSVRREVDLDEGEEETVWRVPPHQIPDLLDVLPEGLDNLVEALRWAAASPSNAEALTSALGGMEPSVVAFAWSG
jgi:hypothetical protein